MMENTTHSDQEHGSTNREEPRRRGNPGRKEGFVHVGDILDEVLEGLAERAEAAGADVPPRLRRTT